MAEKITRFAVNHPVLVTAVFILLTLFAALQFPGINIDTDPENMLSENEYVRVFHHAVKKEFALYDFIVLGIVNEKDANGVFNPSTLDKVFSLTEEIKKIDGVIARDIIAPSTKDNIRQAGLGAVRFEWLMKSPPKTREMADEIRQGAMNNPLFYGTMVSEDGKALCIYIPIKAKDMSYRISKEITGFTDSLTGDEEYYITGLPVAEDTFGIEMFKQMAVSAPLAALIIFLLLWFFFKKINLILSAMLVAMATVIGTMGALIGMGYTVHIMSSMIPIFLMPISVVDSVHILSVFFDSYQKIKDRKKTIISVMNHLFMPMLYTSLTTAAGFFSLAFTPIPPVQVFGVFVGLGVLYAWILTIIFVPAYTSFIPDSALEKFGNMHSAGESGHKESGLSKLLNKIGGFSTTHYKTVIVIAVALIIVSVAGVLKINVNDNPVKWFSKDHRIRIADKVLNEHFGGTYTAYLVLSSKTPDRFKDPDLLRYVEGLQKFLLSTKVIGKTTALPDMVKKIYYELMEGNREYNRIPGSSAAVAQCLISFQNSHKPDDLWHFTNPDYTKINIWVQMKSGDNRDMAFVKREVDRYFRGHALPEGISYDWAGLTYINVIWQDKMVKGMLRSLLGSFVMVFLMMAFLFRSPLWGALSMIPLSVTILFIYGLIGFTGKDYDMPVAVLSALTLGLSVDFAIHFLERAKQIFAEKLSWQDTSEALFKEPARAIGRNAVVIAIGFLPLLAAPLIPYKTVGVFMAAIMAVSGAATLFVLPALISALKSSLFKIGRGKECSCSRCIKISLAVSLTLVILLYGFRVTSISVITIIAVVAVVILLSLCNYLAKVCMEKNRIKG